jgi:hypothetical protein
MLWVFMMLALFRFDGNLGGGSFYTGRGGSLGPQSGLTGIPPNATDGFTGIPPASSFKAMDGFTGIPPR